MTDLKKLDELKFEGMMTLLGLYKEANAGHIGSSLSCLDILIYLYFARMKDEDKFILSKGHAAAGLYTVLEQKGHLTKKDLATFYKDGTYLAAHPPVGAGKVEGIIFGTGSLGHGLSLATGLALSTKFNEKPFNVYCVLSDGDCNEGSTWEAVMFAAQHKLSNLVVIVDNNHLQGFGRTEEVINMEPMVDKWRAFNFDVVEVENGNDFESLQKGFAKIDASKSPQPKCIIAQTTKGSGVSYMEHKMEWHYWPMDDDQYQEALEGLKKRYA